VTLALFCFFENTFLADEHFDISASVLFPLTLTLPMSGDEMCGLELG
jgi:hypothetical protein